VFYQWGPGEAWAMSGSRLVWWNEQAHRIVKERVKT
jgi:hypothetical protein